MYISRIHLLLILALTTTMSAAQDVRYYDIELIVFESLNENAKISESWKHEAEMDIPPLVVELGQPYPGPIPKEFNPKLTFKPLAKNSLALSEEVKLLTESKLYRILLHTSWRQPGMEANMALPVHIKQSFVETHTASPVVSANSPSVTLPLPEAESQTRSILNGYVKVILSRYLHADVNLTYTTNIPLTTTAVIPAASLDRTDVQVIAPPQPIVYTLKQTRKMRSNEVHYLDHPIIGVILLATPYEEKAVKNKI